MPEPIPDKCHFYEQPLIEVTLLQFCYKFLSNRFGERIMMCWLKHLGASSISAETLEESA